MKVKQSTKRVALTLAGVLGWVLIFNTMKLTCLANIPTKIDGLWTRKLGNDLTENILGDIALSVEGQDCSGRYIYKARFYPNGMNGSFQYRTLKTTVNIQSWRKTAFDTITTTYMDNNYRYVVYRTSDGVDLRIFPK